MYSFVSMSVSRFSSSFTILVLQPFYHDDDHDGDEHDVFFCVHVQAQQPFSHDDDHDGDEHDVFFYVHAQALLLSYHDDDHDDEHVLSYAGVQVELGKPPGEQKQKQPIASCYQIKLQYCTPH